MIFGFGRKHEEEDEDDEELELVLFQGALNGQQPDLATNRRLVDAGLVRAKEVISEGLLERAETVRIEPKGERFTVVYLVDGMPLAGPRLSKQEGIAVSHNIKLFSGLDIRNKKPQSGGIKAEYNETPYQLNVVTAPVAGGGERITIRADNLKVKRDTPADLGMPDEIRNKIRELCNKPGMFFVVGPPGSGVTTLLFAVLRGLDSYTKQIFTLGDTGNRTLSNITAYETIEGDSLEKTITRVFRIDADVVCVDPVKDAEMMKMLLGFRENGALVSEFPARDVVGGLLQILKWVEDPALVAEGVNGLLSQKLVRVLCPACRQAYRPNAQFLKKVGLPDDVNVLYRKPKATEEEPLEPCDKCNDTGYFGRVAMFELLEVTEDMKGLIASNPDAAAIRKEIRKENMLTLQQDGLRLVAEGKTSLEELQRVFKNP